MQAVTDADMTEEDVDEEEVQDEENTQSTDDMVFNNKTTSNEAVFDIEQDANNQKSSSLFSEV